MSDQSAIEWTDATWNPVAGCSLCSPGCANCYAMAAAARLEAMGQKKYRGLTRKVNGRWVWTGRVNLDEEALTIPLKWQKPKRVFVNSMSDLFHEDVPFDFVDKVFAVMALCPQHTLQILTKRPERMSEYLNSPDTPSRIATVAFEIGGLQPPDGQPQIEDLPRAYWPLENAWMGTSIEDQHRADGRIPHLLGCPAAVRFLSAEPLLSDIELRPWLMGYQDDDVSGGGYVRLPHVTPYIRQDGPNIHWVIVGGESGPRARPMALGLAKQVVRDCKAAGVPAFVKQLGSNPTNREGERCPRIGHRKGADMDEWPAELRVREFPVAHDGATAREVQRCG